MKKIKLGNRWIGEGKPCFIIAEAGSNHDGKLEQAKQLINIAVEAGADAVKFQTFSAEKLYSRKTPTMKYLKKEKLIKRDESVWDLIKKIEMPREWHKPLADYCKEKGIIFLSTPFDLKAVDELEEVGMVAYKIASFEIVHLPLLEYAAKKGKPMIISTGMADLSDIQDALDTIYGAGNHQVILLHCGINYPLVFEDVNLRAMITIRKAFQIPVGYSDHTLGITVPLAAVALGASVIEKHFTLNRRLVGPDHPFALEPEELRAMIEGIREAEVSMGSPIKKHTKSEEEMYRLGRRSIIAATSIPKGAVIERKMLEIKRPGYGILPKFINIVIGRKTKVDIKEDDIITWEMV